MKKTVKKFSTVFLSVLLCIVLVAQVSASSLSDLQDQYDKLDGQISDLQGEIDKLKDNQKTQQAAKAKIDQQIAAVKSQITILENRISELNQQITNTEQEIADKENQIAQKEELLRQRLKAQYMTPDSNVLTTILGCNSYSEMLRQVDNMVRIAKSDNELIDELTEEKAQIVAKKADLEKSKADVLASQTALDEKRAALSSQSSQLQGVLNDIADTKKLTEEQAKKLQSEQKILDEQIQAIIAANQSPDESYDDNKTLLFPVSWSYRISAPYGYSDAYGSAFHTGIDIARPYGGASISGKPIRAAATGKVISVIYSNSGYGYHVLIDHGAGLYTLYAHCSSIAVSNGQYVTRGQTIAYIGSTGNSTGPHLHFEVRTSSKYGSHVNPMKYL